MINWRNPLTKSVALHLAVCLIIFIAGFEWFSRKQDEAIIPISVEILNITDKNNIPKAQVAASKPKPKPIKPAPPKPKPTPPKPKPKVEPKPEKKPEPKPTEKPVEKPIEKPVEKEEPKEEQVDELDDLLKSLEEEEATQPDMAQTQEEYDPSQPLSVSEVSAITALVTKQIRKCWNVPAGARNAANLLVLVDIDIAEDGTLTFVGFSESANYNDEFYRVAADAARRAVLDPRCNPLRQLPPIDKYGVWEEMTIGFDPKEQIY